MDKLNSYVLIRIQCLKFFVNKDTQLILNDNLEKEHHSVKKLRKLTVFLPNICRIILKKDRFLTNNQAGVS